MRFVGKKWSKLHEESCAPGEREVTRRELSPSARVSKQTEQSAKAWAARGSISRVAEIMQSLLIPANTRDALNNRTRDRKELAERIARIDRGKHMRARELNNKKIYIYIYIYMNVFVSTLMYLH